MMESTQPEVLLVAPAKRTGVEQLAQAAAGDFTSYFCSLPEPDATDRQAVLKYAAQMTHFMSAGDYRISDVIGQEIALRHVFAHRVRVRNVDEESGEVTYVPADRVVLVDDDGETYQGVSDGIVQSLLAIFAMPGIGHPATWTEPLPVVVKQTSVRNQWRTFRIVVADPDSGKSGKASRKGDKKESATF